MDNNQKFAYDSYILTIFINLGKVLDIDQHQPVIKKLVLKWSHEMFVLSPLILAPTTEAQTLCLKRGVVSLGSGIVEEEWHIKKKICEFLKKTHD
jgi:hypothetical protein